MKKSNVKKLESLLEQIMQICEEENETNLTIGISNSLISAWNTAKKRHDRLDIFSDDRGKTWSDMR